MENQKCDHEWRPGGLWDGKTADGKRTGGLMYSCIKCKAKAETMEKIKELGGTVVTEGLDIYGRPVKG